MTDDNAQRDFPAGPGRPGHRTGPGLSDRLRALDSCALSDALDRLGLPGAVAGITPLSGPLRLAGRVITVRLEMAAGTGAGTGPARHLGTAAVESAGPGTVIVVGHPGGAAAGWGGILSLAAHLRGVEGVVVDGPARDIDEAAALGFPVFARSATPVTARGRITEAGWNVPVTVGATAVAPGDLVLGDHSGVVFVPAARAAEVIDVAAGLAAREARMALAVRDGVPVSKVMDGGYERMLERPAQDEG